MAKSLVYVLLPRATDDIDRAVEEMMGPYDESIQMDEYEAPCSCRCGRSVHVWQELAALGPEDRVIFDERIIQLSGSVDTNAAWSEFLADKTTFIESILRRWPVTDAPEKDCPFCGGAGIRMTTYNRDSKWDWWKINPWSSGFLKDSVKEPEVQQHDRDIALLAELDLASLPIPDGIITPDGVWHEGFARGPFALPIKPDGNWTERVKQVLSRNMDCIVVAVDCHNTDG